MDKKAQAAMEFLMTYGWAILVVIAAIAALSFFGVLNTSRLLPERCIGPTGLDCVEKASMSSNAISWVVKNNLGYELEITGFVNGGLSKNDCTSLENGSWNINNGGYVSTNALLPDRGTAALKVDCANSEEDRVHAEIYLNYTSPASGLGNKILYSIDVRK
ncbi:MAG: hypothetical protein ABIE94_01150 [archaeon]